MPHHQTHSNEEMQQCIEDCLACHRICVETTAYCLRMGGRHVEADHLTLMLDCAEICQTSANFMLRGSALHAVTCRACAEVCERCADDCASFSGDQMMQQCAEMCRQCAESCWHMAGEAVPA